MRERERVTNRERRRGEEKSGLQCGIESTGWTTVMVVVTQFECPATGKCPDTHTNTTSRLGHTDMQPMQRERGRDRERERDRQRQTESE